jgi:hypothetical protein
MYNEETNQLTDERLLKVLGLFFFCSNRIHILELCKDVNRNRSFKANK